MARTTKSKMNGKAVEKVDGTLGRVVEALPENVRKFPAVQKATQLVEQREEAASKWVKARAHDAEEVYSRGVQEVETRRDEVVATVQGWMDMDAAKVRTLKVVDGALDVVGLMRVTRHQELLDDAVRSLKSKLRAARERKARREKEKQGRTRSGRAVDVNANVV